MTDGINSSRPSVLELLGPSTGGIRRHVAVLGSVLADWGWKVTMAAPEGVLDGLVDSDHLPVSSIEVPSSMDPARLLKASRQIGRLDRFDLVHAHGLKAGWVAVLARRIQRGPRAPIVLTIHNVVLDEVAGRAAAVQRQLERRLLRRVDRVIAVSPEIVSHFDGCISPDRISFVVPASSPPAPKRDRDVVRRELGAESAATPLVVVAARLHAQKDIPMFIRAWAAVVAVYPDARAAIVGEGPLRDELQAQIATAGVADSLRLRGPSSYAVEELNAADIVVLSSRWEGAPLVVAETMQLGRPLVSTRVGVVPEMIGDGGAIVEVGDHEMLAAEMIRFIGSPELRQSAGAVSRERGTVIYGAEALVRQVADIYEEELAR